MTLNPQPIDPTPARLADKIAALLRSVLQAPGAADPALRNAAYQNGPLAPPLAAYVAKVHDASYRVTDDDISQLLAGGLSQDAVFEITAAAAVGAANQRLTAGLRAMQAKA